MDSQRYFSFFWEYSFNSFENPNLKVVLPNLLMNGVKKELNQTKTEFI